MPASPSTILDVLAPLRGGLIVSCQPVTGGPLDETAFVVALAQAVLGEGAVGLRIEGVARVAAVCAAVTRPVIGIVKVDLPDSPVRITPRLSDIDGLVRAGAPIIAFDATDRHRPVPVAEMIALIHAHGAIAMADVSTVAEGEAAAAAGAEILASTLSGYTDPEAPERTAPDLDLVASLAARGFTVIAEGNVRTPANAAAAIAAGAHAVVVGSAITRPEHVTRWFLDALTP
ncbi:putative N-acetylmannosamine-6-phosphate 2-epimerase [Acidisoma cellulosilytica]|uniref:Putative N-acetylmannosamine-6-phosphate 2-epimerase n=1 Tax=Acidisoma cellulosilyticum TaxID=2802395 RepID=A0A963Z1I8_9PROT|nr:putative N-acetylmannosamine-6-phosphate 2-epimerase [Acidisoma cellulosilyticum]MCB8881113.1 putative N-acetylmannosamine-6-phosphate 2-epimerase [Acidisoma cellulosilyticum]